MPLSGVRSSFNGESREAATTPRSPLHCVDLSLTIISPRRLRLTLRAHDLHSNQDKQYGIYREHAREEGEVGA